MAMILALAAALLYGPADFLGGLATKRARVLAVLPLSVTAGAAVLLTGALLSGQSPSSASLGWGVMSGAFGGVGLIVFYAGLAAGPMSVVAPVSALMSTVVPVGVALAEGERASASVYAGALLCLAAIVLVSSASPAAGGARSPGSRFHGRAVVYGSAAGTAFGLFFLFLRNAGESGTLWPVSAAKLAGLVVILIAASVTRTRPVFIGAGRGLLLATVAAGVLDASANICYLLATRAGLFGLAVVLTSLYPGITVLLARLTLGERLRPAQLAGLAIAAVGVVLVTV
jgi:drug/metabolite transporter (DMT)-like permease